MNVSETNPVALLTPTYAPHLELCTLLCESVDRHVTSFAKHYLLVPDCDLALFSRFASDRRVVIPASAFLPRWLRPLPRMFRRKRRQFWWSLRAKPVSGWHVQQLLKIAATIALPHQRFCILDCDIVLFRLVVALSYGHRWGGIVSWGVTGRKRRLVRTVQSSFSRHVSPVADTTLAFEVCA